jgi:hypothetical protein
MKLSHCWTEVGQAPVTGYQTRAAAAPLLDNLNRNTAVKTAVMKLSHCWTEVGQAPVTGYQTRAAAAPLLGNLNRNTAVKTAVT